MKLLVVAAISLCVILLKLVPAALGLSFDVGSATEASYSQFLTDLRNQVKDKKEYYGIPMMPPPSKPAKYLLIELKATSDISITIALDTNDLYMVGYIDKYQGKTRAHYFPDHAAAKPTLCKGVPDSLCKKINYESRYEAIEGKAGSKRTVGLGINKLKKFMEDVFDKEIKDATEAKFLLVAIQMVSEAARFKYIENQVLDNFGSGFTPDYKILSLENEWYKISKAIWSSKDGSIKPALELKDAYDKKWEVTKVTEIAPDMALLSYQSGKATIASMFSRIISFFVGKDGDHTEF